MTSKFFVKLNVDGYGYCSIYATKNLPKGAIVTLNNDYVGKTYMKYTGSEKVQGEEQANFTLLKYQTYTEVSEEAGDIEINGRYYSVPNRPSKNQKVMVDGKLMEVTMITKRKEQPNLVEVTDIEPNVHEIASYHRIRAKKTKEVVAYVPKYAKALSLLQNNFYLG